MADHDESELPEIAGKPVPDLIEQYRVRRDAWIAQADELARLRDEVRGSAEREAMEIVTAARKNVRQIVMEARRELLVLSAQVQAALGETSKQDPAGLLSQAHAAEIDDGDERGALLPSSSELSEGVFAPEDAVKSMLDEARADMDALVEDARTVPFQTIPQHALPPAIIPPPPPAPPVSLRPPVQEPMFAVQEPMFASPLLSTAASRVLLSSPFPSEAVPVPAGRPLRTFIAFFGVAGIVIVLGTVWWLRSPNVVSASRERPAESKASSSVAPAAATPAATTTAPFAPAKSAPSPSDLSLVVEARQSSWIRTTIDGQSDEGRTFAAGETFSVTAERSVALRVGNAGAVFVSVNKGEALPLGREGQVVTRQFVVEGAKPDAAAPVEPTPIAPKPTPAPSVPTVKGPATSPAPSPAPSAAPAQAPIVQSVAAAPPPNTPIFEASPAPVNRGEPVASTVPRPELTPPGPSSPQSAVLAASRQWLDAYHRQDRTAMAALSTDGLQLADERRNEERFPPASPVSRTLDKVSVQIAADTAVLTAVMTERSEDAAAPRVSPISQVWVMSGGQWRVRQVRLVSEARLNQIFR